MSCNPSQMHKEAVHVSNWKNPHRVLFKRHLCDGSGTYSGAEVIKSREREDIKYIKYMNEDFSLNKTYNTI